SCLPQLLFRNALEIPRLRSLREPPVFVGDCLELLVRCLRAFSDSCICAVFCWRARQCKGCRVSIQRLPQSGFSRALPHVPENQESNPNRQNDGGSDGPPQNVGPVPAEPGNARLGGLSKFVAFQGMARLSIHLVLLSFSTINLQAGPYRRGTATATLLVYQWPEKPVHQAALRIGRAHV